MRSAALLSLVLLGCGRAYELPRPVVRASRRAVLDDAAAACCVLAASALAAVPLAARADLADLDAVEGAAPVPMETVSSAPAIQMITLDAEGKKPKQLIATPGARIKELEAKKDKSEKEKKELRKLKSDEVCDAWTPTRPLHTALSRVARVRAPDRCARCSEEDANLIVRAVTLELAIEYPL